MCQEHVQVLVRAGFGLQQGGLPPLGGASRDREGLMQGKQVERKPEDQPVYGWEGTPRVKVLQEGGGER